MTRQPIIILAGGKGTRLRSVTRGVVPKPMVDVFGRPFLYWLIKHYIEQGFTNIIVNTGHLHTHIEHYLWPLDWNVRFIRDTSHFKGWGRLYDSYDTPDECWIVNGDTYLPHHLPEWEQPGVVQFGGVDAGAQLHYRHGPQKVLIESRPFYDIGTPEGLESFKRYFITHLAESSDSV